MRFLPHTASRPTPSLPRCAAFTLLEVVLAIIIVVGMLLVVLHYYHQAARLRQNITLELERITASRHLMQRIARELQEARLHEPLHYGLTGSSNYLEFITTRLPSRHAWASDGLGRAVRPQSDLKQVIYELTGPGDPAEATGLARSEGSVPDLAPLSDEEFFDIFTQEPAPPTSLESATLPLPSSESEDFLTSPAPTSDLVREFLTDQIRYLRFRFWNGASWVDEWNAPELPAAVQINMGGPPLPSLAENPLTDAEEYPFELFRRVVWLPTHKLAEKSFDIETLLDQPGEPFEEVFP